MPEFTYPFRMSERIVFAEIYCPKKAAYYGAIFDALRKGYQEDIVRDYLERNIESIVEELKEYPGLFDPHQYETDARKKKDVTIDDAKERIKMYMSPFQGWSTYSVDGVFFGEDGKPFEEAAQVVRIMVRFVRSARYKELEEKAKEAGCMDVLRSILYWAITRIGRVDEETGWAPAERKLFLRNHTSWARRKKAFAEKYFCDISREVQKWLDDCGLFIVGYFVRKFWERVIEEEMYEEEIWVTTLFTMNLHVIKRVERRP